MCFYCLSIYVIGINSLEESHVRRAFHQIAFVPTITGTTRYGNGLKQDDRGGKSVLVIVDCMSAVRKAPIKSVLETRGHASHR